ncbi:MAG: zinc ribbon domain-containing protein [Spartobacteria bacterium]|jgi:putative FmdB family regulatory protein|nr:zinc ribbon domain-containing protein [Spartobacteria bacterium]
MPLFEYVCRSCGEIAELLVSGARKPVCPNCGSRKLEKQLSAFSPSVAGPKSFAPPPCGSGTCPARGMGCAGGGCPHSP